MRETQTFFEQIQVSNEFMLTLGIAIIAGIILGIDREIKMKGIGVKTITIIVLSSAMLTNMALEISYLHSATQQRVVDPTRIPSYILSSLGFLGAGVILHKNNNVIAGLTTAAMVWSSAAIGIMIGYGYYGEALMLDILIVVLINVIPHIVKFFGPKTMRMDKVRMVIKYRGNSKDLIKHLKDHGIILGKIRIKDSDKTEDQHTLAVTAMIDEKKKITDVYDELSRYEKIVNLDIEGI